MTEQQQNSKIIEGITHEGEKFRPSDWAERMCGSLSEFRQRRIHYDPRLKPICNKAGIKCLFLDGALANELPKLYKSIIEFAEKNNLRIHDSEHNEDASK